jgi:SAM-dependent methyltransferase
MKNIDLKKKYDEVFKEGSENFFTCNVFREAWTIAGAKDWTDKTVMDVGCGEGMLPAMISHAGASHVVGVDYSKEAIVNAEEKFSIPNVQFICGDYRKVEGKFDAITMQGVMEHLDNPWDELKNMMENYLEEDGVLITSSPSFLNPRGYVWMTLEKLFDVPMSLTDLHFICPFDMENFCEENDYELEYTSIHQDWGSGETMIRDFNKRLRNALRDADMDNSKVDDLLEWLQQAIPYFETTEASGAIVVYRITK